MRAGLALRRSTKRGDIVMTLLGASRRESRALLMTALFVRQSRRRLALWRPNATSAACLASCDRLGQLTPALLLRQERRRPARVDNGFRSGR